MQVMKRGRNVLTLYDRHVAGWILHFIQDDMTVARPYLIYPCVNLVKTVQLHHSYTPTPTALCFAEYPTLAILQT
jgi:hypothetical protein